jgi:ribonuclease HI
MTLRSFSWFFHNNGWVKLNTDYASKGDLILGWRGLICGVDGNWIGRFAKFIGACNVFVAKLCGVFEGLKIARHRGFYAVKLCVDSKALVKS